MHSAAAMTAIRQIASGSDSPSGSKLSPRAISAALDGVGHGVLVVSTDGEVVLINHTARGMLHVPDDVSEGRALREVLASSPVLRAEDVLELAADCERQDLPPDRLVTLSGGQSRVNARIRSLAGQNRALFLDPVISLGRSDGDKLTGLSDRRGFLAELHAALQSQLEEPRLGIMVFDLGRFRQVNDFLGHQVGETLLQLVADRLRSCLTGRDKAARMNSDEFAVLIDLSEVQGEAPARAEHFLRAIGQYHIADGHLIHIESRAGLALAPEHGTAPDLLLRRAMLALRQAKQDMRDLRVFDPSIQKRAETRHGLEADLRQALSRRQFRLNYQPLLDISSGRLSGFEALIRWCHPTRGIVPPGEFIQLAEETGLIGEIGTWVLQEACREAGTWPGNLTVSVNVSSAQFEGGILAETVRSALAASSLDGARLEIEITETALLRSEEATLRTLRLLREMGVRIAMDDFGTGYSSLTQLQSFPFDKLKIDRSFVSRIGGKQDSLAIIRAITRMGSSLGLRTVAEGVETAEQMMVLREEGCDEAQGFLLGRPIPAEEISNLLTQFPFD
jgi:diguanylate cyclase (GGDEF)-like protein